MNKIIYILFLTIIFALFLYIGCRDGDDNSNGDSVCNYHGVYIDGTCDCDEGYTGEFCDIPIP